jgi:hypothetical protein
MGTPAWKALPSWYLVATEDQAIPPDAERQFAARMRATTIEISSSHLPMVSHPAAAADLIKTAADVVAGQLSARPDDRPRPPFAKNTIKRPSPCQ